MKRLVLFVAIAVTAAAAMTFYSPAAHLQVRAELVQVPDSGSATRAPLPVALPLAAPLHLAKGDLVRIRVTTDGPGNVIQVSVTGRGALEMTSENSGLHHCPPPDGDKATTCRQSLRLASRQTALAAVFCASSQTSIDQIQVDIATSNSLTSVSGQQLLIGFLILIALGPALATLRRWPIAEKAALAGIGLCWIAVAGPVGLALDLAFALLGYGMIRWLAARGPDKPSGMVVAAATIALALLFIKTVVPTAAASFANPGGLPLGIPLGISYFAIRMIDLAFAASSGAVRTIKPLDYFSFLFFPYTLPAGPILTFGEFLTSGSRRYSVVDFAAGIARALVGIVKKSVADAFLLPLIARLMNSYLSGGRADEPVFLAAMLFANTLYVYLDFSAYTDLAIGSARSAGYSVPENFDWPLLKSSLRKFWQAWHMTLTRWVMRRVYFPAFVSSRSVSLSMFVAMMVIGIWHAIGLPWIFWAAHHSAAMSAEARLFPPDPSGKPAQSGNRAGLGLRRILGTIFVWSWVSLGHSFTLFASPMIALRCYLTAAAMPFDLLLRLARQFL